MMSRPQPFFVLLLMLEIVLITHFWYMPQKFHCVLFDLLNKRKRYLLLNSLFLEEQSEQENLFQVEESEINFVFMPLFLSTYRGLTFRHHASYIYVYIYIYIYRTGILLLPEVRVLYI